MELCISHGAVFVGLQVAMDEYFPEGMQVLHDGGHMDVCPTQRAHIWLG